MTKSVHVAGFIVRVLRGPLCCTVGLAGCGFDKRVEPVHLANPNLGPMTIAVAPAINLSGSPDFDRSRFADLMAVELGYAEGISVIPVSRVLAVLASEGRESVESPAHAHELVGLLGADAILVFAVTDYDPYDPPRVGISAQLYGARPGSGRSTLDPVALSRQASLAASAARASPRRLLKQTQRVFDASHESLVEDLRVFARQRGADGSAYGWRKYVVSQKHFIRYCCHATLRALLGGRGEEETGLAEGSREGGRVP
jgi:hypothetical protein